MQLQPRPRSVKDESELPDHARTTANGDHAQPAHAAHDRIRIAAHDGLQMQAIAIRGVETGGSP